MLRVSTIAVFLCLLTSPRLAADGAGSQVEQILLRPALRGSTCAILVSEVDTGKRLFAKNADTVLAPASTAKLVSCAGALAALGADFRFETPIVRTGPIVGGQLRGDLVLVGSGDPNLSQRVVPGPPSASATDKRSRGSLRFVNSDHTYAGFAQADVVPGDPLQVLRSLVSQVVAAGVREVTGDVTVDDGLFKEVRDSFVGDFSAICVNDNVIDIRISPGRSVGAPASVSYRPRLKIVDVHVDARTVGVSGRTDLWIERQESLASFTVRGTIALGSKPTLRVGLLDRPALTAAHFLRELLEESGVRVRGRPRQARFGPTIYRKLGVVARHVSPPFSESVKVTLKVSHNLHATMYPVIVGALRGSGGDRASGFQHMRQVFEKEGLDCDSITLQSGSGGGRADGLSPSFLVALLRTMSRHKDFAAYFDALPVAGRDGTLSARFRDSPLRGKVHAKTGTLVYRSAFNRRWIYLSKALAGYIDLRTPKHPRDRLCFAIIFSNSIAADRKKGVEALFRAQEEILEAIVADWRKSRGASDERPPTNGTQAGGGN